ncbi:MAG: Rne/Rng family ribonuclease [Candidatus Binatia bacterium]|nr:Rne/Rng family ribonuclease [Candidatus Binatia bacterium]
MRKQIVVNSSAIETRVALTEGNALAELHLESAGDHSIVGHVFKGKVLRVLPGMQAAFVEIGLDKAAFMHVSDFWDPPQRDEHADEADDGHDDGDPMAAFAEDADVEEDPAEVVTAEDDPAEPDDVELEDETEIDATDEAEEAEPDDEPEEEDEEEREDDAPAKPAIQDVLSKGQEVLVQISKEPIGTKGARITSHISLPGRFVVYTPTSDHIGVSRRIDNEPERKRLREIVESGRTKGSGGYIVRTACEGISKREILADMKFLSRLWANILKKNADSPAPSQLHEDLDIVLRSIRDLFTSDVDKVVVDHPADHDRIIEFIDGVLQPKLKSRVELYDDSEPVFDRFGIETQVRRGLERRVWLKSGGYLVFDQTEALTTIDVNTGRFVGKSTHEETVLKTNLEAAGVSIDQLRLRNIGGIIIIDFIDMEKAANRKKVSDAIAEAVKRDKARTNILRISELGLVQMTRKRTRDNLRQLITSPCPTCSGDGRLRSIESLAAQVMRDARRHVGSAGNVASLRVKVSTELAEALRKRFQKGVAETRKDLGVSIDVRADQNLARGEWEIEVTSTGDTEPAADGEG